MEIKELAERHFVVKMESPASAFSKSFPVVAMKHTNQRVRRNDPDAIFDGYQAYLFNNDGIVEVDGKKHYVEAVRSGQLIVK